MRRYSAVPSAKISQIVSPCPIFAWDDKAILLKNPWHCCKCLFGMCSSDRWLFGKPLPGCLATFLWREYEITEGNLIMEANLITKANLIIITRYITQYHAVCTAQFILWWRKVIFTIIALALAHGIPALYSYVGSEMASHHDCRRPSSIANTIYLLPTARSSSCPTL